MAMHTAHVLLYILVGTAVTGAPDSDPCQHHICQNSGECFVPEDGGLACLCPEGFAGRECQEDCHAQGKYACPEKCITQDRVCDGQAHCDEGEDEDNCDDEVSSETENTTEVPASPPAPTASTSSAPTAPTYAPVTLHGPAQSSPSTPELISTTQAPSTSPNDVTSTQGSPGVVPTTSGDRNETDVTTYIIIGVAVAAIAILIVVIAILVTRRRTKKDKKNKAGNTETSKQAKDGGLDNPIYNRQNSQNREGIYEEITENTRANEQRCNAASDSSSQYAQLQSTDASQYAELQSTHSYTGLQSPRTADYSNANSPSSHSQTNNAIRARTIETAQDANPYVDIERGSESVSGPNSYINADYEQSDSGHAYLELSPD